MARKRTNFRVTFGAVTVLLLGIAVFLTLVLGNLPGARLDLTSDRLYTMTPAAAKILGELKVPVQVKVYMTPPEKMPTEWKNLERDLVDKLRDYQRASDGKLQYQVINPQNDEEMQNQLAQKGIRPFQVQSVERDEIGVKLVWSALTIAYKDYPEETIPQILPQTLANLEYDLVSRVYRLASEKRPKVAIFAPKQEVDPQTMMMYVQAGMQPPAPRDTYSQVKQLLREEKYDVEEIKLTPESRIPDDAGLLLVLNPENLNERQVFEINRALANGLNTIIAVQNHDYDYAPGPRGGFTISATERRSGLDEMLKAFGLAVSKDHFFDASIQVLSIPRMQNFAGMRFQTSEPVRAPMQILVTQPQMNNVSSLTNRIASLLYLWGTSLEVNDAELKRLGLESVTLFSSSNRSWKEKFNQGVVPGSYFNQNNREFLEPQPLAVLVSGKFPDTFQGRALPPWPAPPEGGTPPPDSAAPLNQTPAQLLLVGCAKMFDDDIAQAGQNALFLLNAVDGLALGADLISIRSKATTQRTIKPVTDSAKFAWRAFAVLLVPVAFAVFGLSRAAMRRKEAALYREQLAQRSRPAA